VEFLSSVVLRCAANSRGPRSLARPNNVISVSHVFVAQNHLRCLTQTPLIYLCAQAHPIPSAVSTSSVPTAPFSCVKATTVPPILSEGRSQDSFSRDSSPHKRGHARGEAVSSLAPLSHRRVARSSLQGIRHIVRVTKSVKEAYRYHTHVKAHLPANTLSRPGDGAVRRVFDLGRVCRMCTERQPESVALGNYSIRQFGSDTDLSFRFTRTRLILFTKIVYTPVVHHISP
jgi:hypothetical protein